MDDLEVEEEVDAVAFFIVLGISFLLYTGSRSFYEQNLEESANRVFQLVNCLLFIYIANTKVYDTRSFVAVKNTLLN